jgi:hypothetical protein
MVGKKYVETTKKLGLVPALQLFLHLSRRALLDSSAREEWDSGIELRLLLVLIFIKLLFYFVTDEEANVTKKVFPL